jgi:peptidoglycan/xylan/chitin deacetylase (PgdA/CDA1 family)
VRGLIRAGWEIDSHTITHPDLTTVSAQQLRTELVSSKQQIRHRFKLPARFFCYPAGRYDARVEAAVRAAGYLAATTEVEAYATPQSDPYALPRIRVNNSDTPASLLARLNAEHPAA